jgi:hypothetical protein
MPLLVRADGCGLIGGGKELPVVEELGVVGEEMVVAGGVGAE